MISPWTLLVIFSLLAAVGPASHATVFVIIIGNITNGDTSSYGLLAEFSFIIEVLRRVNDYKPNQADTMQ